MKFRSNDFKMFISTLWYDNVDDYDFFRLKNGLSLTIYSGNFFFNHLTKVRCNFEFKKKWKTAVK
jgi:hypothetical protein